MRWLLPLLLLTACSPPTAITVLNNTAEPMKVSGLPAGSVEVPAGSMHREAPVRTHLNLSARSLQGQGIHRVRVPLGPPGGESVWVIGKGACFAEGDFTSYYSMPVGVPAGAEVVGLMKADEEVYVSKGAVAAGPGERLPASRRGRDVHALLRVPCQATVSEAIARSFLEVALVDIEPSDAAAPAQPGTRQP